MRLLLTHRYFWPDTAPYATILRAMADHLASSGHEVEILASRPSYRQGVSAPKSERLGALKVRRLWAFTEARRNPVLRLANALIYSLGLYLHIRRTRPDIVTASTFPPVLAGVAASLAARKTGARFVYHLQDIHPEVSRLSGGRLGRGLAYRLLHWLDRGTLNRANAVVVLSEDMAATLRARNGGQAWNIHVINNFDLGPLGPAITPGPYAKPKGKRRLIFAGNLGRFQNLECLAEGIAQLFPRFPELELMFLGDGTALKALQAKWATHPQVRFAPFLPFAEASHLMAEADLGLVSLSPGLYRAAYPSKVLSYAALSLPMLALVERESNLAQSLTDAGIGVVPQAPSAPAIAATLAEILADPEALPAMRTRLKAHYQSHLSRAVVLPRWSHLIGELEP